MSTRASIKIVKTWKDGGTKLQMEELFFYRHSDGSPEGTLPTLKKFLQWLIDGKIKNNVCQASGWLILLGAMEYKTVPPEAFESRSNDPTSKLSTDEEIRMEAPVNWKCGAYEPAQGIQWDISYLYEIDLGKLEIRIYDAAGKTIQKIRKSDLKDEKQRKS
jgi:hypothetical protein